MWKRPAPADRPVRRAHTVSDLDHLIVKDMVIPGSEIEETFHTSGGPGGQHANRSETAVRLRFPITESSLPADVKELLVSRLGKMVEVTASDERSQIRNRQLARERLIELLEEGLRRPKKRKKTKPTRGSHRRRLKEKRAHGEKKRLRQPPEIPG